MPKFESPKFDTLTPELFLARFKARVIEVSQGRLSDFSEASALTAIGEAIALVANDLLVELNSIFPQALAASLALMGATRGTGARAFCTVRFQLDVIPSSGYTIPKGHRFAIANRPFQTDGDLTIPAGTNTVDPANYPYCSVTATALEIGSAGNSPATQATVLQPIPGLLGIFLDQPSANGQDEESLDAFSDRIYTQIAGSIGNPPTAALVQGSEFESAVVQILGVGAIAVAVPELSANRASKEIAAMHLFAINPDGSALTAAQTRQLSIDLSPRAPLAAGRLYFSPLALAIVNADVTVELSASANLDQVAAAINAALRLTINPATTASLTYLDLYQAIARIYAIEGVVGGNLFWALQGDPIKNAVQLNLPRLALGTTRTSPAKMGEVNVTFTSSTVKRTFAS